MGNWGTLYYCDGKKAVLHKIPQSSWLTACGIDLYNKIPDKWGNKLKRGWNIEHELPKQERCKKCFPNQRKAKKP